MKKLSLYDLSYGYLKKYYNGDVDNQVKLTVLDDFKEALNNRWTDEDITKAIQVNHKSGSSHDALMRYLRNVRPKEENLLNPENFYWHSQLRLMPGAPKRIVDYNTGKITKVDQEHFLEMKASYTVEDLVDYYCMQHDEDHPELRKKYIGGLKYLLQTHSIDTVLFMIDAAANYIKCEDYRPLNSPLDITDYEEDARVAMGQKITEERTAGDDKIVPRRRLPLRRGRSKSKGR